MMVLPLVAALLATQAASEVAVGDDKIVCKRLDQDETGSRLGGRGKKECKSKAEWRLIEEQTRRSLRAIRDRSGVNPNNPGGRQ